MKASKLAVFAASMTLAVAQSYADQTNLVQNLRIQLFGFSQGGTFSNANFIITPANPVAVNTRRVIAALAAATANTFSTTSRLVVVTPWGGGSPSFQVRDGANTVDVTGFFAQQHLSDSVRSSVVNNRTGRSFTTVYDIQQFALQDSNRYPALSLHFDVAGFAVQNSTNQGSNLIVNVSGTGDRNGNLVIFQGTIEVRGGTLEVVSGGGGGVT